MLKHTALSCSVFLFYLLTGCSSQGTTDNEKPDTSSVNDNSIQTQHAIQFPYTATYTADWEIGGDPSLILKVMQLYKAIEDNQIDSIRSLLADTVYYRTYDNRVISGTPDDFIQLLKQHRNRYADYKEELLTYVALHSKEKNADWVPVWIVERVTRKDGKKDSTTYQESFRFTNGKISNAEGYSRYMPGK